MSNIPANAPMYTEERTIARSKFYTIDALDIYFFNMQMLPVSDVARQSIWRCGCSRRIAGTATQPRSTWASTMPPTSGAHSAAGQGESGAVTDGAAGPVVSAMIIGTDPSITLPRTDRRSRLVPRSQGGAIATARRFLPHWQRQPTSCRRRSDLRCREQPSRRDRRRA
jgi:hypothetical protein